MRIGIVCGCLPTQPGIAPHDLYHQLLAGAIEKQIGRRPQVASTWYVTLAESTVQTAKLAEEEQPDFILYHVRPDPYLRVSKPWLRYRNGAGQSRRKLNFLALDNMIVDVDEPAHIVQRRKKTNTGVALRHLNYSLGYVLGVNAKAIQKEKQVIEEALAIARQKNIPMLIIGPASRPRSGIENFLLRRLEKKLQRHFAGCKNYITCFGSRDAIGTLLFFEDGVHVNKAGHRRFSELIFAGIKPYFNPEP